MGIILSLKDYIKKYGVSTDDSCKGCFHIFMGWLVSYITGYNHNKYWRRRQYVVDKEKGNLLLKIYYLLYIKRVDSKRLSSLVQL